MVWSLMSQLKNDSEELDSECEDVVGVPQPIYFTYITFFMNALECGN